MRVEIREIECTRLVKKFDDVKDVTEGACGMLLIQCSGRNILYPSRDSQYVEIIKDSE